MSAHITAGEVLGRTRDALAARRRSARAARCKAQPDVDAPRHEAVIAGLRREAATLGADCLARLAEPRSAAEIAELEAAVELLREGLSESEPEALTAMHAELLVRSRAASYTYRCRSDQAELEMGLAARVRVVRDAALALALVAQPSAAAIAELVELMDRTVPAVPPPLPPDPEIDDAPKVRCVVMG